MRTRLEVEGEHQLSALLDFCSFAFGNNFRTCNLQDCFNKLIRNSLTPDDNAFDSCNFVSPDIIKKKNTPTQNFVERGNAPAGLVMV
jgi:hypothetical protein